MSLILNIWKAFKTGWRDPDFWLMVLFALLGVFWCIVVWYGMFMMYLSPLGSELHLFFGM